MGAERQVAPAKLTVSLRVTGVRADGYHLVDAEMVSLDLADELTFDVPWQSGDAVLVDNFLVMHGRRTFRGTRKVLASLIAV